MENTIIKDPEQQRDTTPAKDVQIRNENLEEKFAHINGWGIDADPEDHPNYPMKKYTGDDHQRLQYTPPQQQPVDTEILMSNERPRMTAVFGTTVPPSGVSGSVRRFAFRFSEGDARHWFSLVLADRINAIEGIVDDLRRGHIPNIWAERGWNAEWKYNRKGMIQKIAVGAVVVIGIAALLYSRNSKHSKKLSFK